MTPSPASLIVHTAPERTRVGQTSLAKAMVIGALLGIVCVGGCKPKNPEGATSLSSTSQSGGATAVTTPPSMEDARAPQPDRTGKAAASPPLSSTQADTLPDDKSISIAGGWVNAGGACDSGASVFFNADGTYMSEGEKGTWNLSGKTLTVTTAGTFDEVASTSSQGPEESPGDTSEKAVLTLLSVTDDAARVVLSNGSNANWTRCNS